MAKEERVDGSRGPVKLPWIAGGIIGLVLVCGCAGGLSAVLVFGGAGEQGGGEGGEGLKERMAIRWAALSHKFHSDPFSAPSGSTVHINQSQAMGPRPLDETIINELLPKDLGAAEALDVLPGDVQVNLYQDDGAPRVTRVTLDLDRDGKLDELWKVEGSRVRRAVSTADDEGYDQMWLWQNGLWLGR